MIFPVFFSIKRELMFDVLLQGLITDYVWCTIKIFIILLFEQSMRGGKVCYGLLWD